MSKLSEKKYLSLNVKFRDAKAKFQMVVRDSLKTWLKENKNFIAVPKKYLNDFNFFIDGANENFDAILYDEKNDSIYLRVTDSNFEYDWTFAEEDMYIVDAVMNLYYGNPPMFPDSDDDNADYGVSEYLEGDADTRTGEIFDNYYGLNK